MTMYVFRITLENTVTGERAPSFIMRGETEQDARDYTERALATDPERAKNLRYHSATKRLA